MSDGRRKFRWIAAACCIVLAGSAATAGADELHLKNGDRITGYIVSMDGEEVVVRTSYGELTIDRSQILSGTFAAETVTPDDGLQIELLFDGDPDIPLGSNLTIAEYGVSPATGADGEPESAIRSAGNGTYMKLSGTPQLDTADTLTISFWVFPREAARLQYALSKWDTTEEGISDGKFAVGLRYSALYVYMMDSSGNYHLQNFEDVVPIGEWTHVVIVFEAGQLSVYRNGAYSGGANLDFITLKDSASPLYIMTARAATDEPWSHYNLNGMLDNLRIYSRALSETEIAALAEEM